MIIDKLLEFCDAQLVNSTSVSDGIVDLGATPTLKNIGGGEPIYLVINVDTAGATADAGTIAIDLCSDSTENLATSPTTHFSVAATGAAAFTAGLLVACVPLPSTQTYERYLGLKFTEANTVTALKLNAFLTLTPPSWAALPDAI